MTFKGETARNLELKCYIIKVVSNGQTFVDFDKQAFNLWSMIILDYA